MECSPPPLGLQRLISSKAFPSDRGLYGEFPRANNQGKPPYNPRLTWLNNGSQKQKAKSIEWNQSITSCVPSAIFLWRSSSVMIGVGFWCGSGCDRLPDETASGAWTDFRLARAISSTFFRPSFPSA